MQLTPNFVTIEMGGNINLLLSDVETDSTSCGGARFRGGAVDRAVEEKLLPPALVASVILEKCN